MPKPTRSKRHVQRFFIILISTLALAVGIGLVSFYSITRVSFDEIQAKHVFQNIVDSMPSPPDENNRMTGYLELFDKLGIRENAQTKPVYDLSAWRIWNEAHGEAFALHATEIDFRNTLSLATLSDVLKPMDAELADIQQRARSVYPFHFESPGMIAALDRMENDAKALRNFVDLMLARCGALTLSNRSAECAPILEQTLRVVGDFQTKPNVLAIALAADQATVQIIEWLRDAAHWYVPFTQDEGMWNKMIALVNRNNSHQAQDKDLYSFEMARGVFLAEELKTQGSQAIQKFMPSWVAEKLASRWFDYEKNLVLSTLLRASQDEIPQSLANQYSLFANTLHITLLQDLDKLKTQRMKLEILPFVRGMSRIYEKEHAYPKDEEELVKTHLDELLPQDEFANKQKLRYEKILTDDDVSYVVYSRGKNGENQQGDHILMRWSDTPPQWPEPYLSWFASDVKCIPFFRRNEIYGCRVLNLKPGSPAENAGLRIGQVWEGFLDATE